MTQVVDQPTRGNNMLDLLLTNRPSLVNRLATLTPISTKNEDNCVPLSVNTIYIIAKKHKGKSVTPKSRLGKLKTYV